MIDARLADPAGPLLAFSNALGIPLSRWHEREELTQLTYGGEDVDRHTVAALHVDQIKPLADAYGDALTCRFLLGDVEVLAVGSSTTEADLDSFRSLTASTPTVTFAFRLDKTRLIEDWLGRQQGCHTFLYLFPDALARFMTNTPQQLERRLWDVEADCRVVMLVPACEIWLTGPLLSIVGGARIADWRGAIASLRPDAERLRAIYAVRADNVRWQEEWVRFLTPLHLCASGRGDPDNAIANALHVHLTNLIAMYTADRTVRRGTQWIATYADAHDAVEVPLASPADALGPQAGVQVVALSRLFDWVYDPAWAIDRLFHIQIVATHALTETTPAQRYGRLLERADPMYKEAQRHWKSFIAGKVDAYSDQVRALEDYVAATVQLFADQVAAVTKSLSDTTLAAVAALLASFIAAIFQSTFNSTIFTFGMVVYAVYVLLFPLAYNMLYQWQRYRALVDDFMARRIRFEERLSADQVQDIVATRVTESRTRFKWWFWSTAGIYAALVILALSAAIAVPKIVEKPAQSHKVQSHIHSDAIPDVVWGSVGVDPRQCVPRRDTGETRRCGNGFMGSFDDAVVRSICGSNDENLCAWWVADVVATGHMNNRNGSGSGLAARDPSFCCRASSLTAMVGIVHGRSIVAAV